jgi:hypothetical protein
VLGFDTRYVEAEVRTAGVVMMEIEANAALGLPQLLLSVSMASSSGTAAKRV